MKIALILLSVAFVFIAGFLAYSGALSTVVVKEEKVGPFHIVYREVKGSYRQTGKVSMEIQSLLKENGIDNDRFFAVYLDDPRSVPEENLRSLVGHILPPGSREAKLPAEYKSAILPEKLALVSIFPLKTQASIFLGMFKVYPAIFAQAAKSGYPDKKPSLEIYEPSKGQTIYIYPFEYDTSGK